MNMPGPLARVKSVVPSEKFRVRVTFQNDVQKEIDLEKFLRGEIFETIRKDSKVFRSVKVMGRRLAGRTARILTLMFCITI